MLYIWSIKIKHICIYLYISIYNIYYIYVHKYIYIYIYIYLCVCVCVCLCVVGFFWSLSELGGGVFYSSYCNYMCLYLCIYKKLYYFIYFDHCQYFFFSYMNVVWSLVLLQFKWEKPKRRPDTVREKRFSERNCCL